MNIESILKEDIRQAVESCFQVTLDEIILQPTKREFEGFYTFVTFSLTKSLRKPPLEIGETVGNYLKENSQVVSNYNVVQGFLNISLKNSTWLSLLQSIQNTPDFGTFPAKGQSVLVEFSSPNTNKPLHLGHLRNNFLGDSVSRILKANGYDVIKACLVPYM
jgi:arginyl-tRNA synthetase